MGGGALRDIDYSEWEREMDARGWPTPGAFGSLRSDATDTETRSGVCRGVTMMVTPARVGPCMLKPRMETSNQVLRLVGNRYSVAPGVLLSRSRSDHVARARGVLMWLLRQRGMSYPSIGQEVGRTHATALHWVRKIDREWRRSIVARVELGALLRDDRQGQQTHDRRIGQAELEVLQPGAGAGDGGHGKHGHRVTPCGAMRKGGA